MRFPRSTPQQAASSRPVAARLRPVLWRARWLVVALCLGAAAWITIGELRPAPPATVPVVVAARDLPAGTVLTEADVIVAPVAQAPAGTVPLPEAIGHPVTIAIPAGVPIVPSMLLGPGLVDAAPAGSVVVPVPLADPVLARLLRVGDRVDLYLAPSDAGGRIEDAALVAAGALVLARGESATAPTGALLGAPGPETSSVIVVAIAASDAAALTGASGFGPFRAVLTAP